MIQENTSHLQFKPTLIKFDVLILLIFFILTIVLTYRLLFHWQGLALINGTQLITSLGNEGRRRTPLSYDAFNVV